MKTLLLLGGSGFFGKSFLDYFRRNRMDRWSISKIIVVSRNASRLFTDYPFLFDKNIEIQNLDIASIKSLPYADYIIHMAASTDARTYAANPSKEQANIEMTVINYCHIAKSFHKESKILYVSSGAVYGTQPPQLSHIPETYPIYSANEDLNENKRVYTIAKRNAEQMIQELGQMGQHVSIARCFAFIGPYLPLDQHFAIGNFILNGLNQTPILVKAKSPVIRSYLFADDLVEWLMQILEKASPACPIYNVGSDQEISIIDLAIQIGNIFEVDVIYSEQNKKPIDQYVPAIAKAKKEGMIINYNLNEALLETIHRIKANKIVST